MKKIFSLFLVTMLLVSNCYGVDINDWKRGDNSIPVKGTDSVSDIDTLVSNYIVDPLDSLITHYDSGLNVYYTSDDVVTVAAGEVVCSNGAGTIRRMRKNTATTAVDFTAAGVGGIDSGSARDDSSWFNIYAVADADATTFTAIAGKVGTALSDVTYYTKIGTCYNDAADNLTSGLVHGISSQGRVVQVVNTQTGVYASGTTAIPLDDTIPQITEGDEYMTLAITPTSATNKLRIDVTFIGSPSISAGMVVALFQDTTANALAVAKQAVSGTACLTINFTHYMTAGTTSATTFRIRAGHNVGATTIFNGDDGAAKYGGVLASSITITEYK